MFPFYFFKKGIYIINKVITIYGTTKRRTAGY
jgi:hypothetical protein